MIDRVPTPACRKLRIFALDPSLGSSLTTYESRIATVPVAFEHDETGHSTLQKGPVGEYLEVVDVDPASNRFYEPVDLDDPRLIAQDGHEPSEGNPQFHQQMVYAVAMRTIDVFEEALGRKALWAASPAKPGSTDHSWGFVQRLRLYPHALRTKNAYYSPTRQSILFGYFPSEAAAQSTTPEGTMVFSCLSADVIAHEMTHALLDGASRGFRENSNPDVLAFHEGFADIVALFQHFSYRDLVYREIAQSRGKLGTATLLGGLAKQFGEAASRGGPLRDYLNFPPTITYRETFDVHDRGSLLVKAVYDAFLTIVERRTGDLVQLASDGTGILRPGALHPLLVERLTDETCRAARHVMRMAIRALDYCVPVDISFGSYLRALITADLAQISEDRFNYRMAFLESFRRLDLLPTNLRTVSIETLQWRRQPSAPTRKSELPRQPDWLRDAVAILDIKWQENWTREEIFRRSEARRLELQQFLKDRISQDPEIAVQLGINPCLPKFGDDFKADHEWAKENADNPNATNFQVASVRAAQRVRPNGRVSEEIVIVVVQRRPEPIDKADPDGDTFWFRGGVTLVVDPRNENGQPEISYAIFRRMDDSNRLRRERAFRADPSAPGLRAMYFGDALADRNEPFALIHRREED